MQSVEKPNVEIVFASSDTTKANYNKMITRMPWCQLPFNDARVRHLGAKYEVHTVPTVVLLDQWGGLVCRDVSRYTAASPIVSFNL